MRVDAPPRRQSCRSLMLYDRRSEDRLGVDAAVVVEIGILDGDDGQLEVVGDLLRPSSTRRSTRERGDLLAVGGVDAGGGRRAERRQLIDLRDVEVLGDDPAGTRPDQHPDGDGNPRVLQNLKQLRLHVARVTEGVWGMCGGNVTIRQEWRRLPRCRIIGPQAASVTVRRSPSTPSRTALRPDDSATRVDLIAFEAR